MDLKCAKLIAESILDAGHLIGFSIIHATKVDDQSLPAMLAKLHEEHESREVELDAKFARAVE